MEADKQMPGHSGLRSFACATIEPLLSQQIVPTLQLDVIGITIDGYSQNVRKIFNIQKPGQTGAGT